MPSGSNTPPVLPPANDPGLVPSPDDPTAGFLDWLSTLGGLIQPPKAEVYPKNDPRNNYDFSTLPEIYNGADAAQKGAADAAKGATAVWSNLTQVLQGIGLDLHSGLQGLQDGLPIFGVFAMLFIVFLLGLGMFLAEGEKSIVREVLPSVK